MTEQTKRAVALAAILVTFVSLLMGFLNIFADIIGEKIVAFSTVAFAFSLGAGVWFLLSYIDSCLAKAAAFTFLSGAVCPSTGVLFDWYHDDQKGNCWTSEQRASVFHNSSDFEGIPCGWAYDAGYPCLSPHLLSWGEVSTFPRQHTHSARPTVRPSIHPFIHHFSPPGMIRRSQPAAVGPWEIVTVWGDSAVCLSLSALLVSMDAVSQPG